MLSGCKIHIEHAQRCVLSDNSTSWSLSRKIVITVHLFVSFKLLFSSQMLCLCFGQYMRTFSNLGIIVNLGKFLRNFKVNLLVVQLTTRADDRDVPNLNPVRSTKINFTSDVGNLFMVHPISKRCLPKKISDWKIIRETNANNRIFWFMRYVEDLNPGRRCKLFHQPCVNYIILSYGLQ